MSDRPAEGEVTKLERFLREHRIKPAVLARISGHSRQHIYCLRFARIKHPRRGSKEEIAVACSALVTRHVDVDELFD